MPNKNEIRLVISWNIENGIQTFKITRTVDRVFCFFGTGWYWTVLDGTGWYWMVLEGIGWCWMVLDGNGWMVLEGIGWYWMVLDGIGSNSYYLLPTK